MRSALNLANDTSMTADRTFPDGPAFAAALHRFRAARDAKVAETKTMGRRRVALTRAERTHILAKTGHRCHICGGMIAGADWEADHVFAHSTGGDRSADNYLPAHRLCNNYRWHYGTEEFQWILKLGVWLRSQIERQTPVGTEAARQFLTHERRRANRRKCPSPEPSRVATATTTEAT